MEVTREFSGHQNLKYRTELFSTHTRGKYASEVQFTDE